MLRRLSMVVSVLLLSTAGCARGGSTDEPHPSDSPVRVEVTNRHALAVEIYATGGGTSRRLGTVLPGMSAHFAIPANITTAGDVELEAGPNASPQRFRSGPLLLSPGTIVQLIVAPQLFNSTATLRP